MSLGFKHAKSNFGLEIKKKGKSDIFNGYFKLIYNTEIAFWNYEQISSFRLL